jgi:hypothetical protein
VTSGFGSFQEQAMEPMKDASGLYEVERRQTHAARPGFRIKELQISRSQQVAWRERPAAPHLAALPALRV